MFKVRMHAGLLSRNAPSRIVLKESIQKVEPILFEARDERTGFFPLPLRECGLVIGEGGDSRPSVFVRSTEKTIGQDD
jgi:hypothetical protein